MESQLSNSYKTAAARFCQSEIKINAPSNLPEKEVVRSTTCYAPRYASPVKGPKFKTDSTKIPHLAMGLSVTTTKMHT